MFRVVSMYRLLSFTLVVSLLCTFSLGAYAEEATNPDTLLIEGRHYFQGDGVVQDLPKGASLILSAANAGSFQAMLEVASLYKFGFGKLVSEDYLEGTGPDCALLWYEKAAEVGDPELVGIAIANDAFDYFLGSDDGIIKENDVEAIKYFHKAAEYENASAINMLATFYIFGYGVEQNPIHALTLFSSLAEKGNNEALYSMEDYAYAYYAGTKEGIDINFSISFQYYEKLAEYGNERAMYNIGLLYEYGLGIAQNHTKAVEWLTKAQDAGYEPSKSMLSKIDSNT